MQEILQQQERALLTLANKQGIAFPLSLPTHLLYEFMDDVGNQKYISLNYSYLFAEENYSFISYVQDEVDKVYKNAYTYQ